MSETAGGSAGQDGYRIGDAEREAATAALDDHREAGRLDAVEFEERQVRISRARTWSEVQPEFADLPQPHPAGMPEAPAGAVRPFSGPGVPASPEAGGPSESRGLLAAAVPERYRSTVMALTPFAALVLFLVTKQWMWFLAIPVMGILLYGADGEDPRRRQAKLAEQERRRLARDQRRAARLERRDRDR